MIETRQDSKRGCGWRKPGGLYLIAGGVSAPCGLLPIPLTVCPTCSCGIKPTRGWTWVDVKTLATGRGCKSPAEHCFTCPLSIGNLGPKQGLLWIGGKFYARPEDWTAESIRQGVSRRISAVPKDFTLGETWVLVAHREAIKTPCPNLDKHAGTADALLKFGACETCQNTNYVGAPGIFHAFKPTAIEYVVKGDESEEELERIVKRGITPVRIERIGDQTELNDTEEDLVEVEA